MMEIELSQVLQDPEARAAHERSSEATERLVLEVHPFLERIFPALLEAARLQQTTNQRFKSIGLPKNRGVQQRYQRVRVDLILDALLEHMLETAYLQVKEAHHLEIFAPGWDGQ